MESLLLLDAYLDFMYGDIIFELDHAKSPTLNQNPPGNRQVGLTLGLEFPPLNSTLPKDEEVGLLKLVL